MAIVLMACSGAPGMQVASQPASTIAQVRALWVDGYHAGIRTRAEVDQLIADATTAKINTLLVQVRRRGDALYRKSFEPVIPELQTNFDPLAYVTERAHAAKPRIQVHAWVNALVAVDDGDSPAAPHVTAKHGRLAQGDDMWLSQTSSGNNAVEKSIFLDPGNLAAQDYMVQVYKNIARNYDVDGLHMDLIRFGSRKHGYNPMSVRRFNESYVRMGTPQPDDAEWSQWRRDQVTTLVQRIRWEVKALKPAVQLSAAVIAWGDAPSNDGDWKNSSAYRDVFADWQQWLRDGLLDTAYPMHYDRESNPQHRQWFDRWMTFAKTHAYGRGMVIGLGAFLNTPDETRAQARRALAPAADGSTVTGVAFFSYADASAHGQGFGLVGRLFQPAQN